MFCSENNVYLSIAKEDYNLDELVSIVCDIMDSSDFLNSFEKASKVLLKPNLVSPMKPEKGVTTNPVFVEAVIINLKNRGFNNISIGESGLQDNFQIFVQTQMTKLQEKYGVELIHFDKYGVKNVKNSGDSFLKNIPYSEKLHEHDIIINLPKLKIHHAYLYTGAVKNMYGSIPGKNKLRLHAQARKNPAFEEMIVDVFSNAKVTFSIMDGVVGHEGNGPSNGTPVFSGYVLGSESALALDMVATDLIGIDYEEVGYLKKYKKRFKDFEYNVCYCNVDESGVSKMNYEKPDLIFKGIPYIGKMIQPLIRVFYKPTPKFIEENCIGCNLCVEHCPNKALTATDKIPTLKKSKCISCFCCQEACMSNGIIRSDAKQE